MATHSSIPAWRFPMDRGAWQATVHGVTKSRTRLSTAQPQGEAPEFAFPTGIRVVLLLLWHHSEDVCSAVWYPAASVVCLLCCGL